MGSRLKTKMISRLLCWIGCHKYQWRFKEETWELRYNVGEDDFDPNRDIWEYKRNANYGECVHCGWTRIKYLDK